MSDTILKSEIEIDFSQVGGNVAQHVLKNIDSFVKSGGGQFSCIGNTATNESYNYEDVDTLSYRVASWLISQGFVKGDTVLYSSHDGAKLHIFLLAVWRIGGIARSSYPEDLGSELIDRIKESQVKWILCDEETADKNLEAVAVIPWAVNVIVAGTGYSNRGCFSLSEIFKDNSPEKWLKTELKKSSFEDFASSKDDIALILQTSGTTGNSKGAVYTHLALLKNIIIFQQIPFTDQSREPFLLTSRLTHFTGSVIPLAFLAANRRILINSKPSLDRILGDICKYRVNGLLAFPKFLLSLGSDLKRHEYDISSLKYVVTAGQVVGPSFVATVRKIPSLSSLYIIYGLTEIGIVSINADWASLQKRNIYKALDEFPPFSCGKLAPGNEMMVKQLETGLSLGAREVGEFYFRSPYSSLGYFKKPEVTGEIFQNGWIRTGDVGFYDRDGFIYIKDRIKDIFKYFNNHICPSELENILLKHPDVAQASVVGVPDPEGGDTIPRAFVVLKNVACSSESLLRIKKFLNDNVAAYKQLRGGIYEVPEMPTGKSGKVLRSFFQKLHTQQA